MGTIVSIKFQRIRFYIEYMHSPLYCMVSKFKPIRLGSRKVFLVKSQVPSPTTSVSEL
jgi:hypothetical protein